MSRRLPTTQNDDEIIDVTPETIDGLQAEDISKLRGDTDALENDIAVEMGESENDVSYKVTVFRIPDTGKDFIYLFQIPGENVTGIRERLLQQYGAGHYSIQVYKILPRKGARMHRKFSLRIETPQIQVSAPVASDNSGLAAIVAKQSEMLQLIAQRLSQPTPAPATDPVAQFQAMASMAKAMRDFMGGPATASPPVDPFAMMRSVIDLVKDANNEGREKSIMDQVTDVLNSEAVKVIVQQMQHAQTAPPALAAPQIQQPQIPQPRPQPQPAPAARPAAPAGIAPDVAQEWERKLGYLVTRAEKGSDVVTYAEWTWDNLDPQWLGALLDMPDPINMLAMYNPAVGNHRDWFGKVFETLYEMREEARELAAENAAEKTGLTGAPASVQMAGAHVSTMANTVADRRAPHVAAPHDATGHEPAGVASISFPAVDPA